MNRTTADNLTWRERPFAELVRLSWPIATSTISYALMTLVDTLLIGRVGRSELAGVALGGMAAFVLLCFALGLLRAANTLVAQAVGAGRPEEIPALRAAALVTAAALGVMAIGAGQLVAAWLLPSLAATEAAGRAAATYLAIRILGAPLVLSFAALRESRYGQGDARAPMVASVIANLVNIGLASLFVFPLKMGVAGAALATVIAHGLELGLLAVAHTRKSLAWPSREQLRAMWRLGVPTGLQFVLEVGAFALLALMISLLSEAEMAAHQIAIQIIHFSFLPTWAVGEAAAVLTGQAVGARADHLVVRVSRIATLVGGVYSAACALVYALTAPWLARAFTADPLVVGTTIHLLWVAAVFGVFDAANIVARGVLRGAGDVRFAAVVGVMSAWVATPPLTWLLGYKLGLGAVGGWIGLCLEVIISSAILVSRVERRRWLKAAEQARTREQPEAVLATAS